MLDISESAKDHFFKPRNTGLVDQANATGLVGSLERGEGMQLNLRINPHNQVIEEVGFLGFGCGMTIATASALTEFIKGKTLDELRALTDKAVRTLLNERLGSKAFHAHLGFHALQSALLDYEGTAAHREAGRGKIVCHCSQITDLDIKKSMCGGDVKSVSQVISASDAGAECCACHEAIEDVLAKTLMERGESFDPEAALKTIRAESLDAESVRIQDATRENRIAELVEALRPSIRAHSGDVELVAVRKDKIYVKLSGACMACHLASVTLNGIQDSIVTELGEFVRVLPHSLLARMEKGKAK